jgi:hypothetical protein
MAVLRGKGGGVNEVFEMACETYERDICMGCERACYY